MTETPSKKLPPAAWLFRLFCQGMVRIFYRHCEVDGLDELLKPGPVLLCANHSNALADAVILQALSPRLIHPLARSGLFKNPLLHPFLAAIEAVPVYRRQDNTAQMKKNVDSFARVYEMLAKGEVLLIFPEGQSHSDPKLRHMKTGAARMALGAAQHKGVTTRLLPVGMTFSHKGRFRSTVLIKFGEPIPVSPPADDHDDQKVHALTNQLQQGMESVTLNADAAEELAFLHRVERFFALRHGKYRQRSLELRFRAMKKLLQAQRQLQEAYPVQLHNLHHHMQRFERLCSQWGIRDYQLSLEYRPGMVLKFILRSLFTLLVILPLGAWGIINSLVPFLLTRKLARWISRGSDQYDTAKMVLGLVLFSIFWALQSYWVYGHATLAWTIVYVASLAPSAGVALLLRRERKQIWENLRTFFIFVRKRRVRTLLSEQRQVIEKELAHLVRLAKQEAGESRKENENRG